MDSTSKALEFCLTSPNAVILTLWPSGGKDCVEMANEYLERCGAIIKYYSTIKLKSHAAVPVVRALYHGEDWLESNCWYDEQPLETGPPNGPHAGAKWKKALCFKNIEDADWPYYTLHTFVVDASKASTLWSKKYTTRAAMSRKTGNPGNSCMHITDPQSKALSMGVHGSEGGFACDDSFAFHCARALFDKNSLNFLNIVCADESKYDKHWDTYTTWLSHPVTCPRTFPIELLKLF